MPLGNEPPFDAKVTKRQFLRGMSVSAGGLTLTALGAPKAAGAREQPAAAQSFDVIIMGAGSAGIPAAIFAAARGAKVLVVDKSGRIGGGIEYSGGQLSAAGTRLQKRKGIEDSPDAFYADIMRLSYGKADPTLSRLFVDNAADLVNWLEDLGHTVKPDHPIIGSEHEPFSAPRYIWAHGTTEQYRGKYIVNAMMPDLQKWIDTGRVTVVLRTSVDELIQAPDKSVIGVVTMGEDGTRVSYHGKNILLAAGGCGANPGLFERLHGKPLINRNVDVSSQGPYIFHQGKGIELGLAAGGVVRGGENYSCGTGTVCADRAFPSPPTLALKLDPNTRPPWEIQVNEKAERFIREDEPGLNKRKQAQTEQSRMRSWVIFDQEILDKAPPLSGRTTEQLLELFDGHPMFSRGATINELAIHAGLPPVTLAQTIENYNQGVATQSDHLGRINLPLQIAKAPFYAIETDGTTLTSYAGLTVDSQLRVVSKDGNPIPNLYAAGEILGMSAISGAGTIGGCALTPALTFGRLLGEKFFKL